MADEPDPTVQEEEKPPEDETPQEDATPAEEATPETPVEEKEEKKPEAPVPPVPETPKQAPDGSWSVKVDGHDIPLTQDQARLFAQKGVAAEKRFYEAARMKRDAETFFNGLKTDQERALRDVFLAQSNGDKAQAEEKLYAFASRLIQKDNKRAHDLAVDLINKHIEESQIPPELREAKAKKIELDAREEAIKAREEEIQRAQIAALQATTEAKIGQELPQAIKKLGIPDTKENQEWVLREAIQAEDADEPITIEEAATRGQMKRLAAGMDLMSKTSPEEVEAKYPDLYKGIVDYYTKKIRSGGASTPKPSTRKDEGENGRSGQKPRTETWKEARARIMERAGQPTSDDY